MKRLAPLLLLAFAGCSVDNSDRCGEIYSYTETQTDATGIVLEPSSEMYIDFETVSQAYQDTMACMGTTAPPPIVSWQDFRQRFGTLGGWGVYIASGERVWVNTAIDEIITRNCASDIETLKHEYVHHILYKTVPDWQGHGDPRWDECGFGLVVVDGVPQSK